MDVRAEGEATLSRFSSGTDVLLWYLGAIAQTLRQRPQFAQGRPWKLLDEPSRTVGELARVLGKP
ncbi:MAG: hypothetical protein H0W83_09595 [Planctomycetes bacterium]|nr:hypothetical protein [Planctomycetota bacterium]